MQPILAHLSGEIHTHPADITIIIIALLALYEGLAFYAWLTRGRK